jgi:hypothetical protein
MICLSVGLRVEGFQFFPCTTTVVSRIRKSDVPSPYFLTERVISHTSNVVRMFHEGAGCKVFGDFLRERKVADQFVDRSTSYDRPTRIGPLRFVSTEEEWAASGVWYPVVYEAPDMYVVLFESPFPVSQRLTP